MDYIGQNLDRFSNVEKLDAITPATSTGAGPYNLLKGGVAFTPSSADTMVVSIDGVIQYGNFSVTGSTITFNAALADANTCDFIYHMGTGLLSTPVDNSVSTAKIVDSNVTTAKIANDAVTNAKILNESITINGSAVALGGSVTVGETKPTISSISPTVIENTQTAVTITGTNFISVPIVEAINSSGNKYVFNGETNYSSSLKYGLYNGSYIFQDVPDRSRFHRVYVLQALSTSPAPVIARSETCLLYTSPSPRD